MSSSKEWWRGYGRYVLRLPNQARAVVVSAQGSEFKTADGRTVLDFSSGQMCAILGHSHPRLIRRALMQAKRLVHTSSDHLSPPVFEAAAALARVCRPPLQRTLFLSTGAEANECAIRLAKACTGRTGLIGLKKGYYGSTYALLCAGAHADYETASLRLPDIHRVHAPFCRECPAGAVFPGCGLACLAELETFLRREGERIAAMLVEPILAAEGVIVPPPGYFRKLRTLLARWKVLLIADEAQTGFGRTGAWFGMEHHGIVPDILVFAKGAGGGFPAAGLVTSDAIAKRALRRGFWSLSSHQQEPLAATAVSEVIRAVEEDGLLSRARSSGAYLEARLREVAGRLPGLIADIRGKGLLLGVELGGARGRETLARKIHSTLLAEGIRFGYGCWRGVFRLGPPLNVTLSQVDRAVKAFERSLLSASDRTRSSRNRVSSR